MEPAVTEPVCVDTDNGAVDPYGDDCAAYNDYPGWCGNYDDDDFMSMDMCCICGGGEITENIVTPEILAVGPNGEQQDCAGTCGGCAVEDNDGICSGDSTCQVAGDLSGDGIVNVVDIVALVTLVLSLDYNADADFNQVIQILCADSLLINTNSFEWLAKQKKYDINIKPGRYCIRNNFNNNELINLFKLNSIT